MPVCAAVLGGVQLTIDDQLIDRDPGVARHHFERGNPVAGPVGDANDSSAEAAEEVPQILADTNLDSVIARQQMRMLVDNMLVAADTEVSWTHAPKVSHNFQQRLNFLAHCSTLAYHVVL
jgi:hypothetical protein